MTSKREILEMVARGELDPARAQAMLAALERRRARRAKWLSNPLESMSENQALGASTAVAVAGVALSRFGVRFDGVIDVHLAAAPVPLSVALLDGLLAWPLVALMLWGATQLLARQGRLLDFVLAVGLGRFPLLIVAAATVLLRDLFPEKPGDPISGAAMTIVVLVLLPALGWSIALLFQGFRTASGLRGRKLVLTLIATLVFAELVIKLVV